jgi:predicted regulator of Ras-like GTPase activity (Roadblock/LC7/MglB family)
VPGSKTGEEAEVTEDALLALLRALRDRVAGITDTALASLDGLIITSDTAGIDPDSLAALAAASLGIAQRMGAQAGQGTLREATTRSSGGIVAVYAVGTSALLVVVGGERLDTTSLHRESRPTVEAIEMLLKRRQSGIGGAGMAAS